MDKEKGETQVSLRNEISIAVVREKMDNIEKTMKESKAETVSSFRGVREDIKDLSDKLDDKYLTKAEHEETKKDVESLKDNVKWISRLIIGAVVTAILGFVIMSRQ